MLYFRLLAEGVVALSLASSAFFSERGKRYSRDLVQSLVLSALTVSYHETSRRAQREAGVRAAAITVWRELRRPSAEGTGDCPSVGDGSHGRRREGV